MSITNKIRDRVRGLNSEQGLQLLFLVVAIYMFIQAQAWGQSSKVFPQMMAGAVIVGTLLLIFQDYLPNQVKTLVATESSAFDQSEVEEQMDESESDPTTEISDYERPLNPILFTGILITLYLITGYFFSFLIVSPIFVAVYLIWFQKPWPLVILLSIIALLIAYAFATLIVVPVDEGVFVGDLLMGMI